MIAALAGSQGPLARLWRCYERQLEKRPVATQSVTSALLWGAGDLLAQRFSSEEKGRPDLRRTTLTAVFGGACIGPCGHIWYSNLDKLAILFGPESSARFLLAKILLDSTAWNVFYMSAFFLWGEVVIDKGNMKTFVTQMQEEFVPTYLAEVAAWPPIMAAIFTRLPVSHHLLAVNLVTVLDVAFLAIIRSGSFTLTDLLPANLGSLHEETVGSSIVPQEQKPQNNDVFGSMLMVPALASMHSSSGSNRSKAKTAAAGEECSNGGVGKPAFGRMAQVIENWVLPEHREGVLKEPVKINRGASKRTSSHDRA